jgi:hypothetical protein
MRRGKGRLEKPVGSLLPEFSPNSRGVSPQAIDGELNPLIFQPASDGLETLAVVKGDLYLRPHCPQLPGFRKWLFSTAAREVSPCTSYPLI